MPKDTFFNLPKEKQNRIIKAVVKEISNVPVVEMSINKIIQEADIPRGSFYQYFRDKNDVIEYIMEDHLSFIKAGVVSSFKENGGDVFIAMENIVKGTIEFGLKSENKNFCRNILSQVNSNMESSVECAFDQEREFLEIFKQNINTEELRSHSQEDIEILLELLFSALKDAVARCLYDVDNAEEIVRKYKKQLEMIKKGALKEIK